jgi:hypothetical protein
MQPVADWGFCVPRDEQVAVDAMDFVHLLGSKPVRGGSFGGREREWW